MMSQPKLMINDTSRIDSSELEVNVEFPVSDEDNGILELGQTDNSSTETTVHPRPVCSLDGHQKLFADSAAFWRRQTEKPHVKFADPLHVAISEL
ncbi:hypothetical protein M3Y98_01213000 [Aphelenchoides besseyi]|nr:hypothetical protein M3Y98_01213000 [Aphelenchoides besseyi]